MVDPLLSSKELFVGKQWSVKQDRTVLPDGREKEMERIYSTDTVVVLPLIEPGMILVLREYRAFLGTHVWVLPSGKVDKEKDPVAAAHRELREETGMRAEKMTFFGTCYYRDTIAFRCYFYVAEGLVPDPLPPDATELIEVYTLSIPEAITRIVGGENCHAASGNLLLRYAREHGL